MNNLAKFAIKSVVAVAVVSSGIFCTSQAQAVIWTGPLTSFTNPDNDTSGIQDVITSNVILDRGNSGSIFNAVLEPNFSSTSQSPLGTSWARGSISDGVGTLSFGGFVPNVCLNNCGTQLGTSAVETVMYSTADDLYVDVIWDDWTSGGGGGFTYRRSTATASVPFEFSPTMGFVLIGSLFGFKTACRKYKMDKLRSKNLA